MTSIHDILDDLTNDKRDMLQRALDEVELGPYPNKETKENNDVIPPILFFHSEFTRLAKDV